MGRTLRWLLVAVGICMFAPALFAQNAVVLGTVYDAKGQPMPGITVLLENNATGFTRIAITGADGSYTIPEVPPADGYIVTASRDGADLDKRTNIAVNVGDERSILPPLRETAPPPPTPVVETQPAAAAPTTEPGGAQPAQPAPTPAPQPVATGPAPVAAGRAPVPRISNPIVRNETTQTSIGGVITGDQLRSLPLYNRNFLVLGLLTPNAHDVEAGSALTGASFSISGQRPSSNNFLLDGIDNVASSSNQAIPFQVNDAIQEFRVTSMTANAEYGRGAGGVVSVVTRRGTNQLHGAVFGYFAHDALNSENPLSVYRGTGFDKAAAYAGSVTASPLPLPVGSGASPSTYNQYVATAEANGYCTDSISAALPNPATCVAGANGSNTRFDPAAVLAGRNRFKPSFFSKQFGANVGGPVIANKLFYFGSYEATLIDNPTPIFERVPSAFDRVNRNPGDPNYDIANAIVNLYPQANVTAVPNALEFFQGEAPNYTNVHNALLRSDWTRSSKQTFNFRYAGQLVRQLHDDTLPESSAYAGNGAFRNAQNQNGSVTFSYSITPRTINEVRVAFTQFRVTETPQDRDFDATSLGLPSRAMPTIQLSGLDTQYSGAQPGIAGAFGGWYDSFWTSSTPTTMLPSLDGQFPIARLGAPFSAPSARRDNTWMAADSFTWSRGKHSYKFGGEYRFIQNRVVNAGFTRGLVASGNIGEFTSDSESCNVALIGGLPCGQAFRTPSFDYSLTQQDPFTGLFSSHNFAVYAQDAWRAHKRLTINLGVRYDYFGIPKEANSQIWNFDPAANGLVQQNGSLVTDPYGYTCGNTTPQLDSVPRDRSFGQQQNWTCAASSNGFIIKPDKSNFGGRAGVAWDVFGTGETIVRAGIGIFYDQTPVTYMSQLLFNRPTPLNLTNPRYVYGQNFLGTSVPGNQAQAGLACQQCGFGNSTIDPANLQSFFQAAASPFALYARDTRSSSSPYTRQNTLTVQQALTAHATVEVGYIGASGRRLPIVVNRGFNNEWFCNSSRIAVTPGPGIPQGTTQPVCDTFSYFPVFTMANIAESNYHSVMARFRVAQFHGLRANATYTWSKSLDNASSANFPLVPTPLFTQAFGLQFFGLGNPFGFSLGQGGSVLGKSAGQIGQTGTIAGSDTFQQSVTTTGAGAVIVSRYNLPQDPQNALSNEYGRSDFDSSHRVVVDFNYDLPWMKDNKWLGGFQLSGIFAAQSGQPFTIFSGPVFGELTQRVNASNVSTTGDPNNYLSGTFTLPARVQPGGSPSSQCGYALAPLNPNFDPNLPVSNSNFQQFSLYTGAVGTACTGTSGRNQFTGPAFASLDLAIQKGFKFFGEGRELTFRTEVFNVINRANYYNPISILSLDGFTINPEFGQIKSAQNPRQFQFAVRFTF